MTNFQSIWMLPGPIHQFISIYLITHCQKETVLWIMLLLTTAILVTSTSVTHYIGGKSLVNAHFPLQHHYYPHLICIALVVDQIWGFLSDGPVKQAIVVPATPLTHHLQWVTVRPASESDDNGDMMKIVIMTMQMMMMMMMMTRLPRSQTTSSKWGS